MQSRLNREYVLKWYKIFKDFEKSGQSRLEYCKTNNLKYPDLHAITYRFYSKSKSDPQWYAKYVPIALKFMNSMENRAEYAARHNLTITQLSELCTHLRYLQFVKENFDENPLENTEEPMSFLKVPAHIPISVPVVNLPYMPPKEPEVIPARNNIELVITKGVKVIVSPELASEKLIKIIELLKDL